MAEMKTLIRIARNKRGVFLALGMLFIGIVLVSHAVLLGRNAQQAEELAAKLAALDRVYDLDASLQKSIREIFFAKSGISAQMTNTSISFLEVIPNLQASLLNTTMRSFESYIESKIPSVNISTKIIALEMPISISPLNINYTHTGFGGQDIIIKTKQQNFNGFNVGIILNQNVTGCSAEFEEQGSLNFSYNIIGPDGNTCSGSSMVAWDEESEVEINGEALKIELEDGQLSITFDEEGLRGTVNTTLLASVTKATALTYPPALVSITENTTRIHKDSSVTLMRLPS
ncbi:hypothetical protein HYU14_05605 [Candidatus Woesearchaeota archaeon]|nr:hypothetical protein [Candidatus Woesearchaeota archaeon]